MAKFIVRKKIRIIEKVKSFDDFKICLCFVIQKPPVHIIAKCSNI